MTTVLRFVHTLQTLVSYWTAAAFERLLAIKEDGLYDAVYVTQCCCCNQAAARMEPPVPTHPKAMQKISEEWGAPGARIRHALPLPLPAASEQTAADRARRALTDPPCHKTHPDFGVVGVGGSVRVGVGWQLHIAVVGGLAHSSKLPPPPSAAWHAHLRVIAAALEDARLDLLVRGEGVGRCDGQYLPNEQYQTNLPIQHPLTHHPQLPSPDKTPPKPPSEIPTPRPPKPQRSPHPRCQPHKTPSRSAPSRWPRCTSGTAACWHRGCSQPERGCFWLWWRRGWPPAPRARWGPSGSGPVGGGVGVSRWVWEDRVV